MPYVTGTATSPDDLRTAISSFAIRTLGNFDDLFGGELGLSAFGGDSVLGLRHRGTGAAYLFDFVIGTDMNNLGSEHVLLGQLLSSASGALTYDPNRYFDQEGEGLTALNGSAGGSVSWATLGGQTFSGLSGTFDVTTFTADLAEGQGPFTTAVPGQALVLKKDHVALSGTTYSQHVFEIREASVIEGTTDGLAHPTLPAPAYRQVLVCVYVGSYNNDGTNATDVSVTDSITVNFPDLLLSSFNARDPEQLSSTAFNDFSTSMWGELAPVADIRKGYFPRSGRLNFTSGVNYEFYGSGEVDNEHFHMVLQTQGNSARSHWWMGRLSGDADFLSTGTNSTGMFLGTSGPHTDEQGVDTYQYPFSYKAANEAYKNPCTVVAIISDDGAGDTIQQQDGGRLGYGPTGANHLRKYGPNETKHLFLQSDVYSIQAGFNSFEGGEAVGMMGARGRTFFPLRPLVPAGLFPLYREYHVNPWVPVEAVLHSLPMPTDRSTIQVEDPIQHAADIVSAPSYFTGTLAANADGWAEWSPGTSGDPQIHFWGEDGADGLSHLMQTYDRIEFRCRLVSPAVGGTAAVTYDAEFYFSTVENPGFGTGGNYGSFDHPASFTNGEWTTFQLDPTTSPNWTNGDTLNGFRFDLFRYNAAPTTGAVVEFDYVAIGETELHRNSKFGTSSGAYAVHLGQFPGVGRDTVLLNVASFGTTSSVELETGHFDVLPVTTPGLTASDLQRPLDPTDNSGLAGYVYKR